MINRLSGGWAFYLGSLHIGVGSSIGSTLVGSFSTLVGSNLVCPTLAGPTIVGSLTILHNI